METREYIDYVLGYYLGSPLRGPNWVNFQMTYRCSLKCKMCHIWKLKPDIKRELTVGVIKKLIDECKSLGVRYISFVGGEALTRKDDVIELVAYTTSKGMDSVINTNACYVDKLTCERLLDAGLSCFNLSLDGARKETHDAIRGVGNYDQIIETAEIFLKLRKNRKSYLTFISVIMGYNFRELADIYRLAKEIGAHHIIYQAATVDNSFNNNNCYDEVWIDRKDIDELRSMMDRLIILRDRDDFICNSKAYLGAVPGYFENKAKYGICLAGFFSLNIDPYGDINVCRLGPYLNVKNGGVSAVWNHKEFSKSRKLIKKCRKPCMMLCYEKLSAADIFRMLAGKQKTDG